LETSEELQEDFRVRAIGAAIIVGVTAFGTLFFAKTDAPGIWEGLTAGGSMLVFHAITGVTALGAIGALLKRKYVVARILVAAQVVLVLGGWAMAQYPFIIAPNLTFADAVASPTVTTPILVALAGGSVLLVPAFWYLYRVFKMKTDEQP